MVSEDDTTKIFEFLKKQGQTNTFRLARELGIDRYRILNIVKKLEEKGAVEFRSGIVKFLKFPVKEKKVVKKLKVKKALPKVIRKTIIKKVYVKPKKLKEQAERIEKLEETIKELQKKVSAQPKIKTIIKKVPVPSAPAPPSFPKKKKKKRKTKFKKKVKKELKKFKTPKFKFLKSIKQLKRPEFAKK